MERKNWDIDDLIIQYIDTKKSLINSVIKQALKNDWLFCRVIKIQLLQKVNMFKHLSAKYIP
jgi:hypothetical protein